MPETSIIIRTFNEEKHLGNLLHAIEKQDYKNYEIIVVDSGSTDKTLEIAEKFKTKIIKIKSRDFTFGYAFNVGCEASSGKYLVLVSAHVIPTDKKWLSSLIEQFNNKKIAMIYGRQVGDSEAKFSEKKDFQRIFGKSALDSKIPINYANNANSAIRKDLWEKRHFDEHLFGLEDIYWAKNMTEKGYLVHYEPKANIYHIHDEKWHQVFNRYRREAIAAVRIDLKHPPQARIGVVWMFLNLFRDFLSSFPNFSRRRIEEITRFRYYQWKGSKTGWLQGKGIDFDKQKNGIFYPTENKAVVIKDKHKAEIQDLPLPEMKPGDILIKVDYVGICGTDLEICDGTLGYYRDGLAKHPIVPGHEFSGTIVKIGSSNKFQEHFKIGQKVVGECILSRGEDSERKEVGVINHNGAYSQYVVMPGTFVHKIPEGLDSKTASLAEPLAVALRAVRRIKNRLSKESNVAVIGAGPVGSFCAQVLLNEGYKVSLFDKAISRLEFLKDKVQDVYSAIDNLKKFDVIIEATGSREVLEKVLTESGFDSTLLLLGFPYGDINYNFEKLVGNEKVIVGSVGAEEEDFKRALELLPELDTEPFTQIILPLHDFKKAWKLHKTGNQLKILLKP
ncbi:glycosyltransferase [Candidatus Woesearchaeota archaeon]|jgi:2-desacetyl-2-hydroxyethyl bacteriochlorophyllide A dehydrogenase|nr:glycosyltransferase [Candidatus Woesearchaeota archaeon]MBT4733066.1 glycosyltransferase [Candidatus Woesearchaeota archaeon]